MKSFIQKLFNVLEDPNQPFVGRNIKLLKIFGLLLPENNKKLKLIYFIFHAYVLMFIVTQWMELFTSRSEIIMILRNVKYAIFASVNVTKVSTCILWQKDWKFILDFITKVDEERRTTKDKVSKDILQKYTFQSKVVTYLYFYLTYCTIAMMIIQPTVQFSLSSSYREKLKSGKEKPLEVVNSWLPVDKRTSSGYIIMIICQMLPLIYSGGWITSYDTNAIAVMTFVCCELELLRRDCQILFGTIKEPASNEEAKAKLAKCHKRHNDLVICSQLFDSCLSSVMLVYVVICSCMLCATAYQFMIENEPLQKIITAVYLIFAVSQLFLYCWHSNEAYYISKDLMLGPYESLWWMRRLSEQKNIHILTNQLDKIIVFSAGPFSSITVTTFINILKGAYSYYTLLSQSQEN
uniref:Odorant receptor n=1 Tax=Heliconius melpomene rosina TaxID=171916 RepID=A0A1S5XXQ3_HELME|nr:olfactory receptor 57 [Heliconius melpomene rosina]